MSKYVIDKSTLTNIATAIRSKRGMTDGITPEEMANHISKMETVCRASSVDELPSNIDDGTIGITEHVKEDWIPKTWNDDINITKYNMWSDNNNIYFSDGSSHKVLINGRWEDKTWNYNSFLGGNVFNFKEKTYVLTHENTYKVLNGDVWEDKVFVNMPQYINPMNFWECGDYLYYSDGNPDHYRLHYESDTWETIQFIGKNDFTGTEVWTDGVNHYISCGSEHYVYKGNKNFMPTSFDVEFYSDNIFTHNEHVFMHINLYSNTGQIIGCGLYELIDGVFVQLECTWSINIDTSSLWEYKGKLYCTSWGGSYVLDEAIVQTLYERKNNEWVAIQEYIQGSGTSGEPKLNSKTITENGTYNAGVEGLDGYSSVIVDVPIPEVPILTKPQMIYNEAMMLALLESADVGAVYQYMGESGTFEQGAYYVVEEE